MTDWMTRGIERPDVTLYLLPHESGGNSRHRAKISNRKLASRPKPQQGNSRPEPDSAEEPEEEHKRRQTGRVFAFPGFPLPRRTDGRLSERAIGRTEARRTIWGTSWTDHCGRGGQREQ